MSGGPGWRAPEGATEKRAARRRGGCPGGFTLVEALFAVVLLGYVALAAASAEAWAARATALAEAREDAAAAAELVLDSLVHLPAPTGGAARAQGLDLDWSVRASAGGGAEIGMRVRARGPVPLADSFAVLWAPPPPSLEWGP